MKWTFGERSFMEYDGWDEQTGRTKYRLKSTNLCPYMRGVVFAILTAPLRFPVRMADHTQHDELYKFLYVMGFVALGEIIASLLIPPAAMILGSIDAGIMATVGLVILAVVLKDKFWEWKNAKDAKTREQARLYPPAPKSPSLVTVWLKSSHSKVCPVVSFADSLEVIPDASKEKQ